MSVQSISLPLGNLSDRQVPKPSWGVLTSIVCVALAMGVFALTIHLAPSVNSAFASKPFAVWSNRELAKWSLVWVAEYVACLLVIVVAIAVKGRRMTQYLGLNRPTPKLLCVGFFIIGAYTILVICTATEVTTQSYRASLAITPVWFVILLFPMFICAPIMEECVFRGFLWRGCEDRLGSNGAFLITSALFALAHIQSYAPGGKLNAFMFGLYLIIAVFFGLFRRLSGGVSTTILLHGAFNLAMVLVPMMTLNSSGGFQKPFGSPEIATLLSGFL